MKNFKKGFTLVEMLIVVVIIGILASALLPRLQSAQAQARDVARVAAVQQVLNAVAAYKEELGTYPTSNQDKQLGVVSDLLTKLSANNTVTTLPEEPQKDVPVAKLWSNVVSGKFGYLLLGKTSEADPIKAMAVLSHIERPSKANISLENVEGVLCDTAGVCTVWATSIKNIKDKICSTGIEAVAAGQNNSKDSCKSTNPKALRFIAIY